MENLKEKLDRMFHPKVVAVVGAKQLNDYNWLKNAGSLIGGKVYSVNIDKNEWPGAQELGFPCVASLLDIPEDVDYVIVAVPEKITPFVMKDAVAKKVGGIHFFTAGFSETGAPEGAELEDRLIKMAEESGTPLIGPNGMGIFHPKVGLRQNNQQYYGETGNFGYISQSGTQAMGFSMEAKANGMNVSKSVSFGNGHVVDCTDILEYLAQDEDTKIIGMYLEGARDGRAFFRALRIAGKEKPTLVWKVGLTEDSSRATMSHTGSKSPSEILWDSMLRQCGAIKIRNVEEMVDTAKALLYLPPFKGDRVALLGVSGGHASELTETFSQAGFRVPAISTESFDEIDSYATRMGGSFRNPFEGASIRTEESLLRTLGILDKDPNIDFIVMELPGVPNPRDPNFLNNRVASVLKGQAQIKKPIAAVITINNPFVMPNVTELACGMLDKGLVAFWGMPRGAKALYNAYTYNQQREWLYGK